MQDTVTQMHYARQGVITDAMCACAERESVGMGLERRASPQAFTRSLQFQAQS
jgi:thiamine biosynthesis protein ThiC